MHCWWRIPKDCCAWCKPDGFVSAPLAGVPGVKQVAAQGMHDVLLDPDFARNRRFYFTYTAPPAGEAPGRWPVTHWYEDVWTLPLAERRKLDLGMERVASARLSEDLQRITDVKLLAEGAERRIALGRDGNLFVTGADRFRFYESDLDGVDRDFAATPDVRRNYSGSVLRIGRDGSIPRDNPWLSRPTVPRALYAHGLRDPEGAAVHPVTGELWTIEHGPQGGDELNRILPGKDYGWPDVSYGTQYDARQTGGRVSVPVGSGKHSRADVEEPRYFWFPSIAPSGMMFYTGNLFPQWKDNLFVGCMSATLPCQGLVRLVLDGDKVVAEERLLLDRRQRVRDIRQAADGSDLSHCRGPDPATHARRREVRCLHALLAVALLAVPLAVQPADVVDHPGKALYEKHCAACHDKPDVSRAVPFAQLRTMRLGNLFFSMTDGKMKAQAAMLDERERGELVDYIADRRPVDESWVDAMRCKARTAPAGEADAAR